ncbi:hypothetical protein T07_4842 [Trichinella nelsoni]|uniref:Uncharacterized protein n=1 Tax=Trichinella nelsoni TaxID=6336 RepID=A0A0V0SLE2_9BILA|nr:hypothetical protein T07_4842 [Trichinella nelsoni]
MLSNQMKMTTNACRIYILPTNWKLKLHQSQDACQDVFPPLVDRSESTARWACSAKKSKKVCEVGSSASFPHVDLSIGIVRPLAVGTPVVVVPSGSRMQRCRDSFQLPSILIGGHSTCYALPIVLPFLCQPGS